jgi:hypothetical protein
MTLHARQPTKNFDAASPAAGTARVMASAIFRAPPGDGSIFLTKSEGSVHPARSSMTSE